jgi:hypothetical protein
MHRLMHRQMALAAVQQAAVAEHQALACGHLALGLLLMLAAAARLLLLPWVMLLVVLLRPRVLCWCQLGGAAATGLTLKVACMTSSWQGGLLAVRLLRWVLVRKTCVTADRHRLRKVRMVAATLF